MELYLLGMGVLGGTVFGSLVPGTLVTTLFIILLTTVVGCLTFPSREPWLLLLTLCLVGSAIGYTRASYEHHAIYKLQSQLETGAQIIEGVVRSESATIGTKQRFILETSDDVRIRVTSTRFPEVHFGDRVTIDGNIEKPESFETDTGRTFNYEQFLYKDRVVFVSIFPELTVHEESEASIQRVLFKLKDWFLSRIQSVIPEPHAALLGGVTVGAQDALGEDLLDDFRDTGLIHIVVLSGFNIAIVVIAIRKLLQPLPVPRIVSLIIATLGIVAFALLVGGGATVVRASIMAFLGLLAMFLHGRHYDILRSLVFAGMIMVIHSPFIALFDPSFQLSFLATLGLIFLAPWFMRKLHFVPERLGLREIVSATLATQVFVLPLLLYMSGIVSFTMVVSNLLVLPIIPIIMLGGGIVGFFGVLSLPVAWLTTLLLGYVLKVVAILALVPTWTLTVFPIWIVLGVYAAYGIIICARRGSYGSVQIDPVVPNNHIEKGR